MALQVRMVALVTVLSRGTLQNAIADSPSGAQTSTPGAGLPGRHAHWVLRTTNLQRSLEFYKKVLGMRVLRHEENPEACPITCNGRFEAAWSKTMVGYQTEDTAYALELTYNYGIPAYPPGEALRAIVLRSPKSREQALEAYSAFGRGPPEWQDGVAYIVGPDDYRFGLLAEVQSESSEPFSHVRVRVQDMQGSLRFYTSFLGMLERPTSHLGYIGLCGEQSSHSCSMRGSRIVGYSAARDGVPLVLEQSVGGRPVRVEQWEGRHAVTLPAATLRDVYARLESEAPWAVVHELRELEENLGTLLIAIVRDPDGLELCLVSAEVFDVAVRAATDFVEPDWEFREAKEAELPEQVGEAQPLPWGVGLGA